MTPEQQAVYDKVRSDILTIAARSRTGTPAKMLHFVARGLVELPPEIGQLTTLELLCLEHNSLTVLPRELRQLKALKELYLFDNPALNLPPEVLGPRWVDVKRSKAAPASPKSILDYYFGLQQATTKGETQPLNEAKVLILGQPEAGKSSLVHALTEGVPTPDFPRTDGIARREWLLKVKDGSVVAERSHHAETLRLNLWDFGGQEIYKSTHTFFLTRRAVYVIVTTARKDTSMDSDLEEWLETARTFGGGAPVWVVVNKHDENPVGGPDEEALIRKYHPMLRGFIRTQCQHSRSGPDEGTGAGFGIEQLRDTLVNEAWAMPEVRQLMSSTALAVKRRLERMPEPTLTVEKYRTLCVKCGETEEGLQMTLLDLWDKLGTVRYFPDRHADGTPAECETAILNPEWVTEAVYRILEDPKLKAARGLVTEKDFARIMKGTHHPSASYHLIESVMRRFSQLYDSGDGHMFIPLLLEDREPEMEWPADNVLRFVYEYPVLPAGLIPQFIAGMSRWHNSHIHPWRKGCVLQIDGCALRVIGDKKARQVEISVARGDPDRRRDALDKVRFKFEELHGAVAGLAAVREFIPIPGVPQAPLLDYRFLRRLEDQRITEYFFPADEKSESLIEVKIAEALGGIRGAAMQSRESERSKTGGVIVINNNNIAGDAEGNAFGERSRVSNSH